MVFDLALDLKSMKEKLGWKDEEFNDFSFSEHGTIGVILYYMKNRDWYKTERGKDILPFRFTYECELLASNAPMLLTYRADNASWDLFEYYEHFLKSILNQNTEETGVHLRLHNILTEALHNTIIHGSGEQKNQFLTIEHYHPLNPTNMILKISNPHSKEWDYRSRVREYLDFRQNSDHERKEGSWGGGFSTFYMKGALISYENEGKDFLALIKLFE